MNYVYVLKSEKDENLYIGSTNDLKRRFADHNSGNVRSTRHRAPFALVYYETYASVGDARKREKALKLRGQARVQLIKRIQCSL